MNSAGEIKARLTAREVLEHYGFTVDRAGFCKCPFHQGDNTGSLKVYDGSGGWHCFACGAGSSVIDFVMRYFNLTFGAAQEKLNEDFRLGLPIGRELSAEERTRAATEARQRREEMRKREDQRRALKEAVDRAETAFVLADKALMRTRPTGALIAQRDATWYNFCEAVKKLEEFEKIR